MLETLSSQAATRPDTHGRVPAPRTTHNYSTSSSRHHRAVGLSPKSAMTVRPSPWRISFVSGLADRWAPFSSRPCLPCWRRSHEQQGPLAPRALPRFIATTNPSATVSSSADFPGDTGYTAYLAPPISRRDEDGFSSCSAHPCHRAAPTTPPERIDASVRIRRSVLPSPNTRRLGLRSNLCRGHLWVHLRCGPVTRSPSSRWLCQSASDHSVSLLSATQATGLLTSALAGFSPAECASLRLDALVFQNWIAANLTLLCGSGGSEVHRVFDAAPGDGDLGRG
jgi:hypothetical protein